MTKHPHAKEKPEQRRIDPTIVTAIIGGIVTIIVAIVAIVPQLLAAQNNKPVPTQAAPTEMLAPSPTAYVAPTEAPTSTQAVAAATNTPAPIAIPSLSCLDGWRIVSSDSSFQPTASPQGNCNAAFIPSLGISSLQDQLQFGLANFIKIGVFGIAAPIPPNANFNIKVEDAFQDPKQNSEFWLAISNDPLPANNVMIMAFQPQYGELRQYLNQFGSYTRRYTWAVISNNSNPSFPYDYNFHFAITGNSVSTDINGVNYGTFIVNSPKFLFLGLRNKSNVNPVQLRFNVSGLS